MFLVHRKVRCAFLRKVKIGHAFNLQSAALILLLSPDGYTTEVSDISDAALVGYLVCDIVYNTADWILLGTFPVCTFLRKGRIGCIFGG